MSGYQVVKHKRRRRRNRKKIVSNLRTSEDLPAVDESNFLTSLQRDTASVEKSAFYVELNNILKSSLDKISTSEVKNIICFGLGNISSCVVARTQLALLLLLKKHFGSCVSVYDPVFTAQEVKLLENSNCVVLKENEEGKHKISGVSFVFMPHCPKQLLNNFLWSNWGLSLSNCVIICNSISTIIEQNVQSDLIRLKYLVKSSEFVIEQKLSQEYIPENIFNDLSLHIFPLSKLLKLDSNTWHSTEHPVYIESDTEFISKKQIPGLKCLLTPISLEN